MASNTITEYHCSQCGSTDPEDTQGSYSGCCNEPVVNVIGCGSGCKH